MDWGTRTDGSKKGDGYFGILPSADGQHAVTGEQSISFTVDGKEVLAPSITPNIGYDDLQHAIAGRPMSEQGYRSAMDHAVARMKAGRSVYAEEGEVHPLPDQHYVIPPTSNLDDLSFEKAFPRAAKHGGLLKILETASRILNLQNPKEHTFDTGPWADFNKRRGR